MVTTIFRLCENGDIVEEATYTLSPQEAITAFLEQSKGNWNTWTYPNPNDKKMKKLPSGMWSYTLQNGDILIALER